MSSILRGVPRTLIKSSLLLNRPSLASHASRTSTRTSTLTTTLTSSTPYHTTAPPSVKVGESIPISYLKDEQDPLIMDRASYPSWVWNLPNSTSPTLTSLMRKEAKGDFNDLEIQEQRRYLQLANRKNIKEDNLDRST